MSEKKEYFKKHIIRPLSAWFFLVLADQMTKYMIRSSLSPGEIIPVSSFFQITYLTNTGIAFSMFQGANTFFAAFTGLVVLGFCFWYAKNAAKLDWLIKTALVLVIAGAAGNLIDRITLGHVTDFLDFYMGNYHWPSFNIADSCVSIGGALMLIWAVKPEKADKEGKNVPDNN